MKRALAPFVTTAALAAIGAAAPAQAQSNVTLYGIVDTTIRYTTNESAAGPMAC